jgi:hypothetical protein
LKSFTTYSFVTMPAQTIRLSFDRPTGNFWVDTGLVVLLRNFGEGEHSVEDVLNWLQSQLLRRTGNKGEYYDRQTGEIRPYHKVSWVKPTDLFIKVISPTPKIAIEGKEYFIRPPDPKFNLDLKPNKKPGNCDLCGEEALLADAAMWIYPFVVDPAKFSNFYSGAKRGLRFCARCALGGVAGYLGWLWKAHRRDALHLFIFHSTLREMERLHREVLDPLRASGTESGSAPVMFAGSYESETTLGLLLALFKYARDSDTLPEAGRQFLTEILGAADRPPPPITLYVISGTPAQAFQTKALREFSKLQRLFRLYECWIDLLVKLGVDNPSHQIGVVFSQFMARQGQRTESIWRDRIAAAILDFGDPTPFVEQFLFDVHARPLYRGTIEVLNAYIQEVFNMDDKFQSALAGFGHSLGREAHKQSEMGLLYALRNAKNPEAFYRVLNDAQFRLQVSIPEAVLRIEKGERIAGVPWGRVKTLLSIYAMNAYLWKGDTKTEAIPSTQEN